MTIALGAWAQHKPTFLELNAGYDIHAVNMKVSTGKKYNDGGLMLYAGYGRYFSDKWGITVGLRYYEEKSDVKHDFVDVINDVYDDQLVLDKVQQDHGVGIPIVEGAYHGEGAFAASGVVFP